MAKKFIVKNKKHEQTIRKHNADSGIKSHFDNRCYKVGKIRYKSWANKVLKAYNIVIYESELVHIKNKHRKELLSLGLSAFDFVSYIVQHFSEIYEGKNNAKILVVRNEGVSNRAVIELSLEGKQYKIKTASPIKLTRLSKMKLLCANARRVDY